MSWKGILVLLLSGCLSVALKAEKMNCPEEGIPVLATQAKVDSFLAIYPDCEYMEGSYSVNNVPVYWIKNDPSQYLLFLVLILMMILGLLKVLFKRIRYFNK